MTNLDCPYNPRIKELLVRNKFYFKIILMKCLWGTDDGVIFWPLRGDRGTVQPSELQSHMLRLEPSSTTYCPCDLRKDP